MATCYRHPSRETGVSCSNCGKPICPDCMTATPVGMRCPDCAGRRQRVQTLRSVHVDPTVTYVLIAINVLMFLGSGASLGRGGADPLTSKVAVVKRSERPGVDVDYLFLQVFVDQPLVTDAQNCGNILA